MTEPRRPPGEDRRALRTLARLCGIQLGYTDIRGRRIEAPDAALLAAVRAVGVDIDRMSDAPAALDSRRQARWQRIVEPVTVAEGGRLTSLLLRLPGRDAEARRPVLRLELTPEDDGGRDVSKEWSSGEPPTVVRAEEVRGQGFVELRVPLRGSLPPGYHRLEVRHGRFSGSTLVISAPLRMAPSPGHRAWGAFLPLHALRTGRSWGVGDLTDLEAMMEWVAGLGGGMVATLPMLASFLGDRPYDHSPYSPASKLFWNELHLDVAKVPELQRSPEARSALESRSFLDEIAALRSEPLVDYRRAMAAKRSILEALAGAFFADPGPRRKAFDDFVGSNPRAKDYASFRANCERRNDTWQRWPERERAGSIPAHGGNRDGYRYHLYAQWLMAEQMHHVGRRARELGERLYFDAPIGVNSDSYDVWRERPAFVSGVSAGCPPDSFFTGGQDWGFPPLHPERIREQGYAYPIACLRHLLRHAGVLRIDHVMGLHRLFWVPHGMDPTQGVYTRYRPEEWYAILALESRRNGTVIVGEDLGTVPGYVRPALRRHGVYRSHVLQMELAERPAGPLEAPPADALAALNTHDMPPFAGFCDGVDIDTRLEQGWLEVGQVEAERASRRRQRETLTAFLRARGRLAGTRAPTVRATLDATLRDFAASDARLLLINLEDLWLEREPQNVPGTTTQYPNWRRRARYSLEEIRDLPSVTRTLGAVNRWRHSADDRPRAR